MGIETPYISTGIAARKYFFKSVATVERMCREGLLKTARKASPAGKAHWQIARSEVIKVCTTHARE